MALDAGCAGYVPKSSRVSALISAVRRAAAGEVAVANPYLEELADHLAHARRHPRQRLTAREHEVLELLAAGLSTAEISHRLIVSSHTVRNHIRAILRKIGAHTRLEAVSLARHSGLLADE
jgi:DNA-binding NarL/FixJ family response regulator